MDMEHHRETLRVAIERGAVPLAIDALVGIAEGLMERGDAERAAGILALALCYPMNRETREFAEILFSELEVTLCPRVILDARTRAEDLTLDELAAEVLEEARED
jgi:hypothetical protein